MPWKLLDSVGDFSDMVGRYPISSASATVVAVNWDYFSPLFLQLGLFVIDFARQRYLRRKRGEYVKKSDFRSDSL